MAYYPVLNTKKIKDAPIRLIDGDRSAKYPKRSEFVPEGVAFLNAESIKDGRINLDAVNFISEEKYSAISKGRIQTDDVVMTTRGNGTGDVAFVGKTISRGLINAQMLILRANETELDAAFLYYFLRSPLFAASMKSFRSGSAQPQLPMFALKEMEIRYPALLRQRRIASILSAYDDLIENNTRRIKILEQMAQTLYREWFVNFRFPGHQKVKMVESELGPIPEGWEVAHVVDFGSVVTGKTPSKARPDFFGADVPFIKLPDMHGNVFVLDTSEHLSVLGQASQANKTIPANTLCVSCIGTAGIVVITTCPSQTNQQINSVVLDYPPYREFLYFRLLDLRETINQYGANGATMVNLNKTKFENLRLVRSPQDIVTCFHALAAPMFEHVRNLQQRTVTLSKTRDFLLPKLISGEIPVETAAELVEQTA